VLSVPLYGFGYANGTDIRCKKSLGVASVTLSVAQLSKAFEPKIDLLEVRRQLTAIRSRRSQDRNVTKPINALLSKLSYIREPKNRVHEQRLTKAIERTMEKVGQISPVNCSKVEP
jgi:hypothetical protein